MTWTVRQYKMDFPRFGAFNKKETFTSSGTFVAPVTGVYRITLQGGGGGGGGAGASGSGYRGGGGGGQGGHGVFYETLTAGTTYSFTIGAGGTGGTGGNSSTSGTDGEIGGDTVITINSIVYTATGGIRGEGAKSNAYCTGGAGGAFKVGDTVITYSASGAPGNAAVSNTGGIGGTGGGPGGARCPVNNVPSNATNGGGGAGGNARTTSTGYNGGAGGDGYITFEYCDV